ncbi:hypothetical protein HNP33_003041 [Comamonas odontotermitis]|uniref:Uncharacterized protein n=1 Tax=Comamonas odontotermitis TaxID=379895 RepID=A0ABR6RIE1_9BURK|nr:hypothetical protein [Comamonas odontotermitis]MBB6578936.1 hypothetical protein [Comamonas odontotermitis]
MSNVTVMLRDAPAKMTDQAKQEIEQKFFKVLQGEFRTPEAMSLSYKAYMTAMGDDGIVLSKDMQSKAESFHKAYIKATQLALGARKMNEETRFDIRIAA